MIRRFKLGSDVELHKRTLEMGLLSLIGPDARRVAGRTRAPAAEHANARAEIGGATVILVATDTGVDVFCAAGDTAAVRAALEAAGAVPVDEEAAEIVRVEHGRPRYGARARRRRHPAGGRPQRARRVVHQGLLRRAGDGRAAVLPRQAEPPPARAAAVRRRPRAATRCGSARRRSAASARPCVSPTFGPIALAIVRREAEPGETLAVGEAGTSAEVVELPFEDPPLTA